MEKKLNELQGELQAAHARIAQLEDQLKITEHERLRFAATEITLNNGRQTTVGAWQNEINQFVQDYETGKTYDVNEVIHELEQVEAGMDNIQEATA